MNSSVQVQPNFLFIGPDKSGSTWLYHVLGAHSQVYLSSAKELFFFDYFFERGFSWYQKYFVQAQAHHAVIGEISHDYLFSQEACQRILNTLPEVKLMVCLREPVARAFSSYLYMLKQGRLKYDFETAVDTVDELIGHGLYAKHLVPYLGAFGKDRIHVAIFDDLMENPQGFFDDLCEFLGIEPVTLPLEALRGSLLAAKPRSVFWAGLARRAGWRIRRMGHPRLVGTVKQWAWLNRLFFVPYTERDKPQIAPAMRVRLRRVFAPDVAQLDVLLQTNLLQRWGYCEVLHGNVRNADKK